MLSLSPTSSSSSSSSRIVVRCNTVDTATKQKKSTSQAVLLYEGPFSDLALRLKVISVTTAALSIVGIPLLITLHTGDVPPIGQLAVGGSAMLGAVGSTVAMSFVFSPYVTTLERIPIRQCLSDRHQEWLLKATTRNILALKVETVFDPRTDVQRYSGIRPFCNFVANGVPLYVHPELIVDDALRTQLVGEDDQEGTVQKSIKDDDDGFL